MNSSKRRTQTPPSISPRYSRIWAISAEASEGSRTMKASEGSRTMGQPLTSMNATMLIE